jgi:thiol:disulfide interchange protein DsbC
VHRILFASLLACTLPAAAADEALIRSAIEAKLGGAKVEGVQATPMPGIYEVRFRSSDNVQIIYTNADATHILIGRLIDVKTDRDLTEDRMRKLTTINMDTLPYDLAVKVRRGNGKRTLVIFSDPHCPACKKFEKELVTIDDITIHYFMYPVIRPELADQSRAVWCAPDRSKAWLDLALRGKPIAGGPTKLRCADRKGARARHQARRPRDADDVPRDRRAPARWHDRRGAQDPAGRGGEPEEEVGGGSPRGQSSHIAPCWRMRPACAPAASPVPQKKSARTAPRIAPPVSCATTRRSSGCVDSGIVVARNTGAPSGTKRGSTAIE